MVPKGVKRNGTGHTADQSKQANTLWQRIWRRDWVRALAIFILLLVVIFNAVFLKGYVFSGGDTTAARGMSYQLQLYWQEHHEYPLWQPYIFSGMPSFGSLMYTPFVYMPGWVLRLFSLLGFPALWTMALHYLLAAMGVYLLLRRWGIGFLGSLLGGGAYMLMPFFVVMLTAGHGSQMMTAAYLPWLLLAVHELFRKPDLLRLVFLACVAGFQLQRGHVQIAYYGWMLMGWYVLWETIRMGREKAWGALGLRWAYFAAAVVLALGLAAVLYLPAWNYSHFSIRGGGTQGLSYSYATNWSFPPEEMLAFVVPDWFGFGGHTYWGARPFTEHSDYLGVVVFFFMILAWFHKPLRRQVWLLFSALVLALLISFGKYFSPVYDLFFNYLPYFSKFRVPSMILILVELLAAILAGIGLQALLDRQDKIKEWLKSLQWGLWIAGGLFILVLLFKGTIQDSFQTAVAGSGKSDPRLDSQRFLIFYQSLTMSLLLAITTFGLVWFAARGRLKVALAAVFLTGLALADLGRIDLRLTRTAVSPAASKRWAQPSPTVKFLQSQLETTPGRIFPVFTLFGSNEWAFHGLASIGGYSPAKLAVYQDFLKQVDLEQGFLLKYYRQTEQGVRPRTLEEVDSLLRRRDLFWLKVLNVRYLVSPYPIPEPLFKLEKTLSHWSRGQTFQAYLYRFTEAFPRAWFVDSVGVVSEPTFYLAQTYDPGSQAWVTAAYEDFRQHKFQRGKVLDVKVDLQKITVETQCQAPGFLVLSEIYYPNGWHAELEDGTQLRIFQTNALLRGVIVPAGRHTITFTYNPPAVRAGFIITGASLLIVLLLAGLAGFNLYRKGIGNSE